MLSDRHYQLLTAYVDGELSARERQAAERLVQQSPQARDFLEKLASDSKELRSLPSRKAPDTLAEMVMETLSDDVGRPTGQPVRPAAALPAPSAISPWLGFVAAVCVLLMVGAGTFLFVGLLLNDKPEDREAENPLPTAPAPGPQPKVEDEPAPKIAPPEVARELDPLLGDLCAGAAEKFGARVEAKEAYVSMVIGQLQEAPGKERLAKVLKKEPAVHLELPVVSNVKAVDRLKDAFTKTGFKVLVDATAKNNLANAKKQTKNLSFVLYAENLKADELSQILEHVGKAEGAARRWGRSIDGVTIKGVTVADRTDLSKMLKVDVDDLVPGKGSLWAPLIPVDPKTDAKNPKMVKPVERFALVLAKGQGIKSDAAKSAEIRQFMAARKELDPRMLQVVLTIHEAI